MTAVCIVAQPKFQQIHIATDSASYNKYGVVGGFGPKAYSVMHWPGALVSRGAMIVDAELFPRLSFMFADFDTMIAGVETALPRIVEDSYIPDDVVAEIYLVGISTKRKRPEAYSITINENVSPLSSAESVERAQSGGFAPQAPFKLQKLPDVAIAPALTDAMVVESYYGGIDPDKHPKFVIKALRKTMETQRHDKHDGIHWVGGCGQLTTITPDGISQRVLQKWPDKIGEKMKTLEIDWPKWCEENGMKLTPEDIAIHGKLLAIERGRR